MRSHGQAARVAAAAMLVVSLAAAAAAASPQEAPRAQLDPMAEFEAVAQRLFDAAMQGSAAEVEPLLSQLERGPERTVVLDMALLVAAGQEGVDVIEALLDAGARADARGANGITPLVHAASKGHAEVVRMLLQVGRADANVADAEGITPLMHAAHAGHAKAAEILLRTGGADVFAARDGTDTALMVASIGCHADVVKVLLAAAGPDDGSRGNDGRLVSLLGTCTRFCYSHDMTKALVAAQASPARAWGALALAVLGVVACLGVPYMLCGKLIAVYSRAFGAGAAAATAAAAGAASASADAHGKLD